MPSQPTPPSPFYITHEPETKAEEKIGGGTEYPREMNVGGYTG